MAKQIFATDNGKVFNIKLDPGYCFAMSLDVARVMQDHLKLGRPKKLPNLGELNSSKWAIIQSAYEINNSSTDRSIIEAQNLDIIGSVPEQDSYGDFARVAQRITNMVGTIVFGVSNDDEAHSLFWYRDDTNGIYMFLDPNFGLYEVGSVIEGKDFIQHQLLAYYDDLDEYYDAYSVVGS